MNYAKKNILIFGGSFDPVHKFHLQLLKHAVRQFQINKSFLVPVGKSPTKKILVARSVDRIKMLRFAVQEQKLTNVYISTYECKTKKISYTIRTIKFFQKKYPSANLFLLIGADQVVNFSNWKQADEIAKITSIIYAPRSGIDLQSQFETIKKYQMQLLKIPQVNTSSTAFRNCSFTRSLFQNVLKYINQNGTYANLQLQNLSKQRLQHSLRTAQMAKTIAIKNKLNQLAKKAYIAGLFHDFAKEYPPKKLLALAKKHQLSGFSHVKTLHGPIATYILRQKFSFEDEEILGAIFYHTEPFLNQHVPTTLEKIVYVADKIEPGRKKFFPISEHYTKVKQLCLININQGFAKLYEISLKYFVNKT